MHPPLRHSPSRPPKVLIVGGGAAGLEALIGLRALAESRVEIELLTPERHFIYRPLAVGEPFGYGAARRYELAQIAADHDVRLTSGVLGFVEPESHSVRTTDGRILKYDALVLALGAKPGTALPGAITVRGPGYTSHFGALLGQLERGELRRVAFAAPPGVAWQLPLYELALMTSARLAEQGSDAELSFVTPEAEPLELFGSEAAEAMRVLLAQRGIVLHTGCYPAAFENGELTVVPHDHNPIATDSVVTLPQLFGPAIGGLPQDPDGFVPVDLHGRVRGVEDAYAAGDATGFPIKQGGLATQQADAAVESIAARAGVAITPQPFTPVLRGLLLTGGTPRYLRAEVSGGRGENEISEYALWWPPSKIAGRHLSPYLGLHHRQLAPGNGLQVDVEVGRNVAPGARRIDVGSRATGRAGAPP